MPAKPTSSDKDQATGQRVQNEFDTKDDNEAKVDRINTFREVPNKSSHSLMSFKCECYDKKCKETIQMSTEEYDHIHLKSRNFVVKPKHFSPDIEKVVATFNDFVIVEKFSRLT